MIVADLTPGHQRLSCWDGPARGYQLMSQYISCGTEERCTASWIGCPAHRGTTNSAALRINFLCLDISGYTMNNVFNKRADSVSVSQVYCFYFLYFTNIHLANMFQISMRKRSTQKNDKLQISNPRTRFMYSNFITPVIRCHFTGSYYKLTKQRSHILCLNKLVSKMLTNYMYYMMTSPNGNISALLALCAGNSPVTGEFPSQRPVTRSFDVFFDLRLNKSLRKQSCGWWF